MDSSHQSGAQAQSADAFEQFEQYPWNADEEFQTGLTSILANNQTPEIKDDLSLRARCFYYSRKTGTVIGVDEYKSWKRQRECGSNVLTATQISSSEPSHVNGGDKDEGIESEPATTTEEVEPPRLSYQEVVELIQSGKPVPGIKDIPSTVLEGQGTQSTQARRKKPWEKDTIEELQPLEVTLESTSG